MAVTTDSYPVEGTCPVVRVVVPAFAIVRQVAQIALVAALAMADTRVVKTGVAVILVVVA